MPPKIYIREGYCEPKKVEKHCPNDSFPLLSSVLIVLSLSEVNIEPLFAYIVQHKIFDLKLITIVNRFELEPKLAPSKKVQH